MHYRKVFNIFKIKEYRIAPIPETIWTNPLHFIAFGFGTGALPYSPGTFGTLIAIPFYLFFHTFSPLVYLTFVVLSIIGSVWLSGKISEEIHIHDHQGMCLDEVVGFLVTMLFVPFGWKWILAGVILFRFFDIWKPWPLSFIDEKVPGGFGMILDDVLAGVYSCIILNIFARVFVS